MNAISFTPLATFTTTRLNLRSLTYSDDQAIYAIRSNEQVNKYTNRQKQNGPEDARDFIERVNDGIRRNRWIYWAICLKDDPTLIGTICVWNFSNRKALAEVGYELHPSFQGQGIMSEAMKCIIDYCFTVLRLETLDAYTRKDNDNSIRLLVNNNFIENQERKDEEDNMVIYTLLRSNRDTLLNHGGSM